VNVLVREACPSDRLHIAQIFADCRQQDFSWLPPKAMSADDFNQALEDERQFVAASADGTICGFLSLWESGCFVHFLFVDPRYQGFHVGNRLIQHLFSMYQPPFRLKCLDLNLRALKYYRREAWVEVGRGIDKDGGHRVLELQ